MGRLAGRPGCLCMQRHGDCGRTTAHCPCFADRRYHTFPDATGPPAVGSGHANPNCDTVPNADSDLNTDCDTASNAHSDLNTDCDTTRGATDQA